MATEQVITKIAEDELEDGPGDIAAEVDLDEAEDIEIEIVDDAPEEDQDDPKDKSPSEVDDDELASYSTNVQKRIKKLRYDFHQERRRKEAAERETAEAARVAQNLHSENTQLRQYQARSDTALIDQATQRAESQIDQAKQKYKRAYDEGDSDVIVEAQEELAKAVAEKQQLSQHVSKEIFRPPQGDQQQQTQAPVADPKAHKWLEDNSWFGTDKEMTGYVYGLHERLVEEDGVDPRSNDYYKKIDKRMREVFPNNFDDGKVAPRKKSVVAGAARSGSKSRIVKLTATQVSLAKRLGLTPKQYAEELLKGDY